MSAKLIPAAATSTCTSPRAGGSSRDVWSVSRSGAPAWVMTTCRMSIRALSPSAQKLLARGWDDRNMRGRWVAVLSVVVLGLVTGCHSGNTRSSTPPSTDSTGPATLTTAPPGAHCRSASTISNAGAFAPTVHGTGHGASLWGLLMFPHPLPARVGDQEKIVWRITSSGPLVLKAIGTNGQIHPLAWGP